GIRAYKVTGVQTCALPISDRGAQLDRHLMPAHLGDRPRIDGCEAKADDKASAFRRARPRTGPGDVSTCLQRFGGRHTGADLCAEIGRASSRERGAMWEVAR